MLQRPTYYLMDSLSELIRTRLFGLMRYSLDAGGLRKSLAFRMKSQQRINNRFVAPRKCVRLPPKAFF